MIKNVLIVDKDRKRVNALENRWTPFADTFVVLTAAGGKAALELLRGETISLVVTDFEESGGDGPGLLKHVMQNYPDIPVIVTGASGAPEMERLARAGGAAGYFSEPFAPEMLGQEIMTILKRESDGGTLHSVSSGIFLQLVEMEQKTCTIRLADKHSSRKGVLFFRDGELLDARVNHLKGKPAAKRILTWEKVTISIQNDCPSIENKIHSELQPLILEAARLKDEAALPDGNPREAEQPDTQEDAASHPINRIRQTIENRIGQVEGVEDIYQDNAWDGFIRRLSALGDHFRSGPIKLCFVDRGESSDHILIPGQRTTVISVNPKSPHDKIMNALAPWAEGVASRESV